MDIVIYSIIVLFIIIFIVLTVILLKKYISYVVDKKLFSFQNDLITKHCKEVENIYNQMRGWRHDYHNHIQALKAYYTLEQYDDINVYLNKLDKDLTSVDTIIKTGNVMIDAILNSKISLATSMKINVNAKAIVPKTLDISEVDLCVIIGNLIDNATEACMKQVNESDRVIRIYIDIFKNYLYISISNTMNGDINDYTSSKGDNHGFGLMRVDRIVKKYDGHLNRQHEEGVFATEVMIPL